MAGRRIRARKPRMRKHRKGRKGGMAQNKKVDERIVLRTVTNLIGKNSSWGAGTYIWYAYSAQNSTATTVVSNPEWTPHATLYDEFCVTSMTMKYRPYTNAVQILQGLGATAAFFNPDVYTFIDRNGQTPVTTNFGVVSKIQQYDSCRIHKWTKPFSRTVKLGRFWTSTVSPLGNATDAAYQPWVQKGVLGVFGLYAEQLQLPPNSALGELTFEFHVSFRGKKPVAFAYDATSGSVILTPLTSFSHVPVFNPPAATVYPDEYLDISGGTVIVRGQSGEQAIKDRDTVS